MKLYACGSCGQTLYFENVQCTRCGYTLGYLPDLDRIVALEKAATDLWQPLPRESGSSLYRMCANYAGQAVCNWMVPNADDNPYCLACRLDQTIPDLNVPQNKSLWQRLEMAKRRLIYSLLRLDLPLTDKRSEPEQGLAFAFLADSAPPFQEAADVMTGHAQGTITINIAEADDAARERMRDNMAEPYRTLLGHSRHEIGHYYWERLVRESGWQDTFRARFGDERTDYEQALSEHYEQGPPLDWQENYVSGYASAHPWEDWAETWAHYLHIVDTLETAGEFGIRTETPVSRATGQAMRIDIEPYESESFEPLIERWIPLTTVVNNLNRSMGQPDLYPFVLEAAVIEKLGLVHRIIRASHGQPAERAS